MSSPNPDAEGRSREQRDSVLKFYRYFPHMARLLNGVGVEPLDNLLIPENEVINMDIQGMEIGYTSCNTPRKLWDALSVCSSLLFLQLHATRRLTEWDILDNQ
jgi:hypothetical protein